MFLSLKGKRCLLAPIAQQDNGFQAERWKDLFMLNQQPMLSYSNPPKYGMYFTGNVLLYLLFVKIKRIIKRVHKMPSPAKKEKQLPANTA